LVTVDTSALIAAIDRREADHASMITVFQNETGPLIIPVGMLSEATFLLQRKFGQSTVDLFLGNLESGLFLLDCGQDDLPRIRRLTQRYHDLPLGYTDAAVITCAERNGGRVATLDLRHFGVVAAEGTIQIVP
jgi:predicted nucleic acid-binding protein